MPLARDHVRLRSTGLVSLDNESLIRFGTVEPHQLTKAALANADLYGTVLEALALPPQAVLALSCFAFADGWTPEQLAAGTRYANYHVIEAAVVHELGFDLWPTETFANGHADPRDPVHFDIVVVRDVPLRDLAERTGSPTQRRALRLRFLTEFQRLLERLEGPWPLATES
jgi:hypothetical protein